MAERKEASHADADFHGLTHDCLVSLVVLVELFAGFDEGVALLEIAHARVSVEAVEEEKILAQPGRPRSCPRRKVLVQRHQKFGVVIEQVVSAPVRH